MPEEQYGKTFDKLFKFLLDKGLVTLGLYRLTGAQDNFTHPYVFTNPTAKTIVTPKDRVFVLGKDIPKDFIIDFSKKGVAEVSKGSNAVDAAKSGETSKKIDNINNITTTKDFYGLKEKESTPSIYENRINNKAHLPAEIINATPHTMSRGGITPGVYSDVSFQLEGGSADSQTPVTIIKQVKFEAEK